MYSRRLDKGDKFTFFILDDDEIYMLYFRMNHSKCKYIGDEYIFKYIFRNIFRSKLRNLRITQILYILELLKLLFIEYFNYFIYT